MPAALQQRVLGLRLAHITPGVPWVCSAELCRAPLLQQSDATSLREQNAQEQIQQLAPANV